MQNESGPKINRGARGFTLIEVLIVMSILGILISIAAPSLRTSIVRAREAVLREDLFEMREAIDQYYADNGKYPAELAALINSDNRSRSYLRELPKDPFTGTPNWITVLVEGDDGGVFDIHSASELLAMDGTPYNIW